MMADRCTIVCRLPGVTFIHASTDKVIYRLDPFENDIPLQQITTYAWCEQKGVLDLICVYSMSDQVFPPIIFVLRQRFCPHSPDLFVAVRQGQIQGKFMLSAWPPRCGELYCGLTYFKSPPRRTIKTRTYTWRTPQNSPSPARLLLWNIAQ